MFDSYKLNLHNIYKIFYIGRVDTAHQKLKKKMYTVQ